MSSNLFPIHPSVVFVGHPDLNINEGYIILYSDFQEIIEEFYEHYHELCFNPEIKPEIYEAGKQYKQSDMTKTEYNKLPKINKPKEAEY